MRLRERNLLGGIRSAVRCRSALTRHTCQTLTCRNSSSTATAPFRPVPVSKYRWATSSWVTNTGHACDRASHALAFAYSCCLAVSDRQMPQQRHVERCRTGDKEFYWCLLAPMTNVTPCPARGFFFFWAPFRHAFFRHSDI